MDAAAAAAQAQFSALLSEKDAAFDATKLALEERHASQVASLLAQTAAVEGSPAMAEASKETAQLFARIDALGRQLSEQVVAAQGGGGAFTKPLAEM